MNNPLSHLFPRCIGQVIRRLSMALLLATLATVSVHATEAPTDPRGTEISTGVIKWEWEPVSGANQYQVNVNGEFVAITNDIYYVSENLSNGNYTFTVQAIYPDGRYSNRSSTEGPRTSLVIGGAQQAVSNTQNSGTSSLAAPADPRGTQIFNGDVKWEWERVNGAQRYEVFVDNASIGFTNDDFVYSSNLSVGDHTMFVRAVDNDGNQSANSSVTTRYVDERSQGAASSSTSTQANLASPGDPRGTRIFPGEIKWEWDRVDGAVEYEVTVDGATTRTAEIFLRTPNLFVGEHTMTVKAINSSGQFSGSSNTARESTWEGTEQSSTQASNLGEPRDVRGTQIQAGVVKWEWSEVFGASGYAAYVNGSFVSTTNDDFIYSENLNAGEHSFSVSAIDSEGRYSNRSATAIVNVTSESSTNIAVSPPPPIVEPSAEDNGLIDPQSYNYGEINQKDGYELVFSDEFNGGSLNQNRWNTQLRWDGEWNGERFEYRIVNGEAQFYVNIFSSDNAHLDTIAPVYNPFQFDGSRLAIRATRNPLDTHSDGLAFGPLSRISTQQPFLSGAISTYDKFSQKYGYFEARIKIPAHVGTFPAFWLHHQRREWEGTQKTEIDIMENLGHFPHYVYNSFHYFTGVSASNGGNPHFVKPLPQGQISNGSNYSDDYHVYAAEWQPGYIRYIIDGQTVSEVWNENVDHEELYVILNLAVGGIWTNLATNAGGTGRGANERFPTQNDIDTWQDPALEIDYVRVYKAR